MSDPTPIPIHVSAETIAAELPVDHAEMLDKVESVKGGDGITLTELNNLLGLLLNSMDAIKDSVNGMAATLETLNNNNALNAQNAQTIALSGIGVCCDDITPGVGLPDQMCEKAQALVDKIAQKLCYFGTHADQQVLPTVDDIVTLFSWEDANGVIRSFLSRADAAAFINQLSAMGLGNLPSLCALQDDDTLRSAFYQTLGTANSAQEVITTLRLLDTSGFSVGGAIVRAIILAFGLSLVNHLWDDPATISPDGYTDICGGGPPPGVGYGVETRLINTFGDSVYSNQGDSWDLSTTTSGGISPIPWPSGGETLYVHYCFNNTTNANTNIYITNDEFNGESVIVELAPGQTLPINPENDRYLFFWSYSRNSEDGPGLLGVSFGWTVEDAEAHCPE